MHWLRSPFLAAGAYRTHPFLPQVHTGLLSLQQVEPLYWNKYKYWFTHRPVICHARCIHPLVHRCLSSPTFTLDLYRGATQFYSSLNSLVIEAICDVRISFSCSFHCRGVGSLGDPGTERPPPPGNRKTGVSSGGIYLRSRSKNPRNLVKNREKFNFP